MECGSFIQMERNKTRAKGYTNKKLSQKIGDLVHCQLDRCRAVEIEGTLNQLLLLLLQLEDLLLDRVLNDQAVYDDFPTLTDSEHAIDGLVFYRFVPPGIAHEHHVG